MRVNVIALGICLGLGMAASSAPASAKQAVICKTTGVSGKGTAFVLNMAKMKARMNWRSQVKSTYGAAWSKLSLAKINAFPCNAVGGGKKSCTLRAKPCKQVGLGKKGH